MASSTEQRKIEIIADGKKVDASFKEMAASARLLDNQLKKLPPGTEEFTKKSKDLQDVRLRMKDVKDEMYGTSDSLEGLKQKLINVIPFGQDIQKWTKNFKELQTAIKGQITPLNLLKGALIGTGIGAIVVILGSLIAYLTTTQEGIDKVNKVLEPMRVIGQRLLGVLQDLGGKIFSQIAEAVKNPRQAFQDFVDFIKNQFINRVNSVGVALNGLNQILSGDFSAGFKTLGDAMIQATTGVTDGIDKINSGLQSTAEFIGEAIDQGSKLAEMNIDIEKTENALILTRAKLNVEYNKQKEIAQDLSKSENERIAAARKAKDAQNQLLDAEQNLLDKKIERKELENSLNDTSREDEAELLELMAERTNFEATAAKKRASARSLENTALKQAATEREKLRKEEENAEEQHQKELERLIKEYNQKKLEAEKAVEDFHIELMEEGEAKRLAKAQLELERYLEELEAKKDALLENTAITEEQRDELLALYDEERRLREQEKAEEDEEIRLEEREARIEKELAELDEEEAIKAELLEQQGLNAMAKESDMMQARLSLQQQFLRDKLKLLEAEGKGETLQAERIKTDILKIDKEKSDLALEVEKREHEFKKQIRDEGVAQAKDNLSTIIDVLGEETAARKGAAIAMKAIQISETIQSTYQGAQSAFNAFAAIPIVGPVLGAAAAAAAVAGVLRVKKIASTKYAAGGATQLEGRNTIDMFYNPKINSYQQPNGNGANWYGSFANGGPIGSASFGLIGEAGPEWVGPNWMIRSPKYANIFGYLESERVKARPFAVGGATGSTPSIPSSSNVDTSQQDLMTVRFEEMIMVLTSIDNRVAQWPTMLQVVNDPLKTAGAIEAYNEIDADSRITR